MIKFRGVAERIFVRWTGLLVVGAGMALVGCGGGSGSGSGGGGMVSTPVVATPVISLASGTYLSVQTVTIADATAGATIYYTTDGTTPGAGSNRYTAPITVATTEQLQATAVESGYTGSGLASASYTINLPVTVSGTVASGAAAIVGAHVYAFAASTAGYSGPSVSLENASVTGNSDALGAYALTAANGGYTAQVFCTAGQQVYLYALGGNAGGGTNAASALMAAIGTCPSGVSTTATVDEVTTIAAAYALAGFAADGTHVGSSGTALAQVGIANAFANAANLANLATGKAQGSGGAPTAPINTLANVLASCVHTMTGCSTLLTTATSTGVSTGTAPTETATAAINIAHHPFANYSALTALAQGSAVYTPITTANFQGFPNAFPLIMVYTAGELGASGSIAVDGAGNVWVPNALGNVVTEISGSGAYVSGVDGWTNTGLGGPAGIALDSAGDAWVTNKTANAVAEISPTGSFLTGTLDITGGGMNQPLAVALDGLGSVWVANYGGGSVTRILTVGGSEVNYTGSGLSTPDAIATDAAGNAWVANYGSNSVTEIATSGSVLSGANGFKGGNLSSPTGIAIDSSGTAWVTNLNNSYLTEISSAGSVSSVVVSGLSAPVGIALDGAANAWLPNAQGVTVATTAGAVVAQYANGLDGLGNAIVGTAVAIDGAGNAWLMSGNDLIEIVGAATPVVTPLSVAAKSSTLATRP